MFNFGLWSSKICEKYIYVVGQIPRLYITSSRPNRLGFIVNTLSLYSWPRKKQMTNRCWIEVQFVVPFMVVPKLMKISIHFLFGKEGLKGKYSVLLNFQLSM